MAFFEVDVRLAGYQHLRGISRHGNGAGQLEAGGAVVMLQADVGGACAINVGAVDRVDLQHLAAAGAVAQRCSH